MHKAEKYATKNTLHSENENHLQWIYYRQPVSNMQLQNLSVCKIFSLQQIIEPASAAQHALL